MSIKISGILKDGMGNPIPNCTIELKSKKTSLNVITKTEARLNLDITGSYSMNVEPCHYDVSLCMVGYPPKHVGDIHVYSDSRSGTLNDFLMMTEESDLTPEVILIFQQLRDEAKAAAESVVSSAQSASADADSAAASAASAALSETNAGQSAQSASADAESTASSAIAAKSSETNAEQSAQSASADAESAAASAAAAKSSETNAAQSAQSASTDAENAATSAAAAASSETNAGQSAQSASTDAESAAASATAAASSETNAGQSAQSASTDAESAAASAAAAASSETNAKASETAAANSATSMEDSVTQSAASAAAALSEANRAKIEADRAAAALDEKQDKSGLLTAIAGLTTSEDQLIYSTDVDAVALTTLTDFGRELISIEDEESFISKHKLNTISGKTGGIVVGNSALKSSVASGYIELLFKDYNGANTGALLYSNGSVSFGTLSATNGNKVLSISGTTGITTMPSSVNVNGSVTTLTNAGGTALRFANTSGNIVGSMYWEGQGQIVISSGTLTGANKYFVFTADGNFRVNSGTVTCTQLIQTSDENKKENPEIIKNALEKISKLRGYTYVLKDTGRKSAGLMAQEVEAVLPESVFEETQLEEDEQYYQQDDYWNLSKEGEKYKGLDQGGPLALMVNALNELHETVKQQAKEIETLKNKRWFPALDGYRSFFRR